MTEPVDTRDWVESHWPYDGLHDSGSVVTAAQALPLLVRYLNNATQAGNAKDSLVYAADVGSLVSNVTSAIGLLPQLMDQLTSVLRHQQGKPTLYDDRRDRPGEVTAGVAIAQLAIVHGLVERLGGALRETAQTLSHLGNDDDFTGQKDDGS